MLIKLDYRETDLQVACVQILANHYKSEIVIKNENLPLGDIIIYDEKQEKELVIIERKTLKDLAASIRDGRYAEQGFRLNECNMHNHNIIYLIEGDLRRYVPYKTNVDKKALISAMVSINYFKGFSLHRTLDIQESAEWIIQMADKLERTDKKSYYEGGNNSQPIKYSEVSKRVKKDNITPNNIGEIMLSQIPGVSVNVATIILNKYGSLKKLILELEKNSNALETITTETKNGSKRKLSKTSIMNIYNFLIHGEEQIISIDTE